MDQINTSLQPKKTLTSRATTAGLYIAAAMIVLGLIVYVTGLNEATMTNRALYWVNNLLLLGAMFYFIHTALRLYRDQDNGGFLSIGQGIGLGTLAGLVAGIVTGIWTYIFMAFIAPDMTDTIVRVSMEEMQKKGLTEEQIEMQMEMAAFFFTPAGIAIMTPFFGIFFGFLSGLLSGILQKRERRHV